MNKGLKKYTKQLQFETGLVKTYINPNKNDSNLHINIPLIDMDEPCPLSLSLIYDKLNADTTSIFGKGFKLNTYANIAEKNGKITVTNADGSTDDYFNYANTEKYKNGETGMTISRETATSEYGTLIKGYIMEDLQGNKIKYTASSHYPSTITMKSGASFDLDFVSSPIKLTNNLNEVIKLYKTGQFVTKVTYKDKTILITYDTNGRIQSISYKRGTTEFGYIVLSLGNACIEISDYYNMKSISVNFDADGRPDEIHETILDCDTENLTTIQYFDKESIVEDYLGRVTKIVFDEDDYLEYVVNDEGVVNATEYSHLSKKVVYQSTNIDCIHKLPSLINSESIDFLNLSGATVTEVSLPEDNFYKNIIGSSLRRVVTSSGLASGSASIPVRGLAGESFTVVLWGRCIQESSSPCELSVSVRGAVTSYLANRRVKLRTDGLFNFVSTGFTASESFSEMTMFLDISENCTVEIGGIQIIKKQFGTEYDYDEKGNLTSVTQNGYKSTISYSDNSNMPTESVDSNRIVYSCEYDDKGNVIKNQGSYGVRTENTYSDGNIKRLLSTKTLDMNGDKIISKSKTYDENNLYVISETDELGNTTHFENIDQYGVVGKIRYPNNTILDSVRDDGLLKVLKLLNGTTELMSCAYTYDSKNRVTTATLKNGSRYSFEYDCANNITEIRLNNEVIFSFEYDLVHNNLTKQAYGDNSAYRFSYNSDNKLVAIYYEKGSLSILKYRYVYDAKKRLDKIEDASGTVLKCFVYDNEDNVVEEKASDYSIKRDLSSDGEVLSSTNTVADKTVTQTYSALSQSKSFNPDSFASVFDKDYFAGFTKNTNLRCSKHEIINIYEHIKNPVLVNKGAPYVGIDSEHLLGYALEPEFPADSFCCTLMMWIKPKASTQNGIAFAIQNTSGTSLLYGHVLFNKLYVGVLRNKDSDNPDGKTLAVTNGELIPNQWNFVAFHCSRRSDGLGYMDERKMILMLNDEIIPVTVDRETGEPLKILSNCNFDYPVYTISHGTDIGYADNKPVFTSSGVINSDVSCLLISNRYGIGVKDIQKYYNETKLYVMDNALKESNLKSVDFSYTSLHPTDETFNDKFTLYPLQNSFRSTKGDDPYAWAYRNTYSKQVGKSFAFDRTTKGYAYVADGAELLLDCDDGSSKTILMKVFVEPGISSCYSSEYPDYTRNIKRYIFDLAGLQNNGLSLGLDSNNKLVVDRFGTEKVFDYVLTPGRWHTIGISYGFVNGKWLSTIVVNYNVLLSGEGYFGSFSNVKLSIGRKRVPYDSDTNSRYSELEYFPLYGQIKQVAVSNEYFTANSIMNSFSNLIEMKRVSMYDDMGMLNKIELKKGDQSILSNEFVYKTKADTLGSTSEELSKYISSIVKDEIIKCGSTTTTRHYESDVMGNITSITDGTFGNHSYAYDKRQFLISADGETYEYDSNGNITKIGTTVLSYDSKIKDKLISFGSFDIGYESRSSLNPTTYKGMQYVYEGRRLVKLTLPSTSRNTIAYNYTYNESGLRIKKTKKETRVGNTITTTTNYYYNKNNLICQKSNGLRIDYLYDESEQLYGLIYNGTKYFYIRDSLKNILGIIDNTGKIVVKYDYTGYGVTTVSGELATTLGKNNPFRFKGYYFDEESSMYYCQSRYYVPEWGRWLNCDSANFIDLEDLNGMNLFAYCNNNPIKYLDPSGRLALLLTMLLISGALLGASVGIYQGEKEGKKGWALAKSGILGFFIGAAAMGLVIIMAGTCMTLGGAAVAAVSTGKALAAATAAVSAGKTFVVMGALGFNFFAMIGAPLFNMDVEPLDLGSTGGPDTSPGAEYEHPANKKK